MSKNTSFEKAMTKLEGIVEKLEDGDVPLEKALGLFEDGVKEIKFCSEQLKTTEQKVEKLISENGSLKTIPFESDAS